MSKRIEFPKDAWFNSRAEAIHESIYLIDLRRRELYEDMKKASNLGLDSGQYAKEFASNVKRRSHFMTEMEKLLLEAAFAGVKTRQIEVRFNAIRDFRLRG